MGKGAHLVLRADGDVADVVLLAELLAERRGHELAALAGEERRGGECETRPRGGGRGKERKGVSFVVRDEDQKDGKQRPRRRAAVVEKGEREGQRREKRERGKNKKACATVSPTGGTVETRQTEWSTMAGGGRSRCRRRRWNPRETASGRESEKERKRKRKRAACRLSPVSWPFPSTPRLGQRRLTAAAAAAAAGTHVEGAVKRALRCFRRLEVALENFI